MTDTETETDDVPARQTTEATADATETSTPTLRAAVIETENERIDTRGAIDEAIVNGTATEVPPVGTLVGTMTTVPDATETRTRIVDGEAENDGMTEASRDSRRVVAALAPLPRSASRRPT